MTFLGYSEGKEPLIGFILVVWAVPVLLIVATILIMRFGYDDDINGEIYGIDYDTTYYLYVTNNKRSCISLMLLVQVLHAKSLGSTGLNCTAYHSMPHMHGTTVLPCLYILGAMGAI